MNLRHLTLLALLAVLLAACGNIAFEWQCDSATGRCEGEARYVTWTPAPTLQTATETPTPTPAATASPTPSPAQGESATPTATGTATPTPTLTPTHLLTAIATPTQETTPVPTAIPGPTAIPKGCIMLTGSPDVQAIRVRSGPGTGYPSLRTLAYNTEVQILEAREDPQGITPAYVWGRLGNGEWFAFFRILPDGAWWARATVGSAEICVSDVPGWPAWLPIPPELTVARPAFGFHEKSPQDTGDMNAAFDALTAGGERVAVKSVETMGFALAQARGGEGYYRPWNYGDCGDVTKDPIQEADRRAEYVLALSRGMNTTYFEVDNECPEYIYHPEWFNRYSARLLSRLQGLHLIFPTQGPGYWEPDDLRAIVPTLDLILANGVCFGYHAYGVTPGVRVVDSGIWLGFRHRQIRQWLIEIDRRYVAIPICATEVGTGAGGEFAQSDFVEYNCAVQHDQYLKMVDWWTAGQWFLFTLNGQMASAARAFVAAPCRRF